MKLLEQLINIASPSGSEYRMKEFLRAYVSANQSKWESVPVIVEGPELHDSLILVFGQPRTAIFAHMDTIGFMVRYQNQLVAIGGPDVKNGYLLTGGDRLGPIRCMLTVDEDHRLFYEFPRAIQTGTSLVFEPQLKVSKTYIQGTCLDNRLGIYSALKVAETLKDGAIVFSCFEEHGGGSVPLLIKYLWDHYQIKQALISDITWVTDGVHHGDGVVISMRDRNIPRQVFVDKIIQLASKSGIDFQLEVEGAGSSDGREIHHAPYPVDWCFIGAPEAHVHSPKEKVHVHDLECMIRMFQYLMKEL